jgi:outer membrane protein insertion porin family
MLRLYTFLSIAITTVSLFSSLYAGYDNQPIESVEISIEGSYSRSVVEALKTRIETKEGGFFSQSDFDNDLKMLSEEYDKIEPELKSLGGKMIVSLHLYPKPMIQEIVWQGIRDEEKKAFTKELGIHIGEPLEKSKLSQGLQRVQKYLLDQGYFEGSFSYDIEQEKHSDNVILTICIEKGRAGKINRIYYDGLTKQEARCLDQRIVTTRYDILTSWLTGTGMYNEDMIQHDQFVILSYLQEHGYADAQVEVEVRDAKISSRVDIIFHVTKGDIYRFSEVTFDGNTLYSDDEIRALITVRPGHRYNPESIRRTVEKITHLYGRKGYIDAYVQFEPKLSSTACEYAGHFQIHEGTPYCVGLIKVFGNCMTKTNVILNECLLTPGETFCLDRLELTEQRLRNIGYFQNVNVYAVKREGDIDSQVRDVHIEVEEQSTGKVSTFFGFSNSEQFMGGVTLSEQNFNIAGINYIDEQGISALRGGGEFMNINLLFGAKSTKYMISWTKPYFCDTLWSVGIQLDRSSNRYVSNAYDIDSEGILVHGDYDLNAFMRFGTHWRLRKSSAEMCSKSEKDADSSQTNENNSDTSSLLGTNGLISAIGTSFQYDSTNSLLRPSNGLRSRWDLELAGLGGEYHFFSVGYRNALYFPIYDDATVLKLKSDIRFIFPFSTQDRENLSIDEKMLLGGDTEVRGYRPYSLGPRKCDDPLGGISLQFCSAEINRRITSNLDAFAFFDAGALNADIGHFSKMYSSVGVGIRLSVMPGNPPLTIGYGIPLNDLNKHKDEEKNLKDLEQRFFINFGGSF